MCSTTTIQLVQLSTVSNAPFNPTTSLQNHLNSTGDFYFNCYQTNITNSAHDYYLITIAGVDTELTGKMAHSCGISAYQVYRLGPSSRDVQFPCVHNRE